jgi:hypothetical protein
VAAPHDIVPELFGSTVVPNGSVPIARLVFSLPTAADRRDRAIVTVAFCGSMITPLEDPRSTRRPDPQRPSTRLETLSLRLIDLWLFAVLTAFFFIRLVGSATARHIFGQILPSHFR